MHGQKLTASMSRYTHPRSNCLYDPSLSLKRQSFYSSIALAAFLRIFDCDPRRDDHERTIPDRPWLVFVLFPLYFIALCFFSEGQHLLGGRPRALFLVGKMEVCAHTRKSAGPALHPYFQRRTILSDLKTGDIRGGREQLASSLWGCCVLHTV